MATIKCKMCGGTMEIVENSTVAVCEYCGSQQTIPRLSDERKANLYDRANHFRRSNEFDKAQAIYEQILNEDPNDAESYWSLVLCKYGIEYVEDPATHKMVPTVNRTQFTSVFEDSNYKEAIRLSDESQKAIYEEEAKAIDDIQKGILEISKNEEPFDVFICYKETDDSGKRTRDSVLGQDLYYELKKAGFKVFFARITLESKLGTAYEPYIFSALNSSKVMVVIGTKPEYFKAVWVRNEWSRFLDMIKKGEKKTLIPAYRDMDPYDLPEEFSFLQAQDMSKLGFMQDLVAGIRKLIEGSKKTTSPSSFDQQKAEVPTKKKNPLLTRAFMFLEDGDFDKAEEYIDKVLDQEPQNPMAYLASVMTEYGIRRTTGTDRITIDDLLEIPEEKLNEYGNYKKALRFADDDFRREYLDKRKQYYAAREEEWKAFESEYLAKIDELDNLGLARRLQNEITSPQNNEEWSDRSGYQQLLDKCSNRIKELESESLYKEACLYFSQKDYLRAAECFRRLGEFKDSINKVHECDRLEDERNKQLKYDKAKTLIEEKKLDEAIKILDRLGDWKDSRQLLEQLKKKINGKRQNYALVFFAIAIIALVGYLIYSFVTWKSDETGHWHSIVGSQVGYGEHHYSLVQQVPPTCEEAGHNDFKCDKCGRTITETIAATGHDSDDGVVTLEPACTTTGTKTYTCKICGEVLMAETIPATGHTADEGKITKEPTCTDEGIMTYTCKTCGEDWTERIPANGHVSDNGKVTKEPTCTTTGTRTYTCKVCGAVVKTETIPATGHTSDAGKVTKEPTCTTTGTRTYTCKVCGAVVKTETIPATGHTSDAGKVTKQPTCATTGTRTYSCTKCGAVVKTVAIPATGEHVYDERECVVCGKAKYKVGDIGPSGGYIFYDCDEDNSKGNADGLISKVCGWRYLEAAPSDIRVLNGVPTVDSSVSASYGVKYRFIFGYYRKLDSSNNLYVNGTTTFNSSNCTKTAIGTGKDNTKMLVAAMGEQTYTAFGGSTTTGDYAARLCDILEFENDGVVYDDWFLPSKDEMNLMYTNLFKAKLGNFSDSSDSNYWSSSEGVDNNNARTAWEQYFRTGSVGGDVSSVPRNSSYKVRAVRSF